MRFAGRGDWVRLAKIRDPDRQGLVITKSPSRCGCPGADLATVRSSEPAHGFEQVRTAALSFGQRGQIGPAGRGQLQRHPETGDDVAHGGP